MGRLTELFAYFNEEEHPTATQIKTWYTHIDVNEDLQRDRLTFRNMLKDPEWTQDTLFPLTDT